MPKEAKSSLKKKSYVGEHLAKFRLFASVSGTDTTSNKEIKYKKELSGVTPCKITVVIFSCAAFVGLPREDKSGFKKRDLGGGTPCKILVVRFSSWN